MAVGGAVALILRALGRVPKLYDANKVPLGLACSGPEFNYRARRRQ
jgi:hypothetical protein